MLGSLTGCLLSSHPVGHQQGAEKWGERLGRRGGEGMEAGRRAGSCREKSLASLNSHIFPCPPPSAARSQSCRSGGLGAQPKADVSSCIRPQHMGPGPLMTFPHVQPSRTSLAGLSGQSIRPKPPGRAQGPEWPSMSAGHSCAPSCLIALFFPSAHLYPCVRSLKDQLADKDRTRDRMVKAMETRADGRHVPKAGPGYTLVP